jgi:hypothetical protein
MKQNIVYKLIGIQEGFSCKSSFLFKKTSSDFEISCPINRVDHLCDLISKKDIKRIKYLKNYLLSDRSRI